MTETRTIPEPTLTPLAPTPLPPSGDLIVIDETIPEERARIEEIKGRIDLGSTQSIIGFGAEAQTQLRTISSNMLEGVRNKDTGPAGQALSDMVLAVRGFDISGTLENRGILGWLTGRARPIARAVQRYETVKRQIHTIQGALEGHKTRLLGDIENLDKLYDATLAYFHDLELYIAAGEERLKELDEVVLPAERAEAERTGDPLQAEDYRRKAGARDDLERRIHDLRLTRQVTMQALPSITLVQDNDKSLVTKIESTVVNTIPLWETQIAQALTIYRSQQAAKTIREASDLTNELLTSNAENLRKANAEVRREIERGVFDIEAVKRANTELIATIQESLTIADEGKARRVAAEKDLVAAEKALKDALLQAQNAARGQRPPAAS